MVQLSTQQHLARFIAMTLSAQPVGVVMMRSYKRLLKLLELHDPDTRAELEAAVAERLRVLRARTKRERR